MTTTDHLEFNTIQLSLVQDDKPKTFVTVPIDQLKLSRFNPRVTRPDEDINRLAQRIARNGFEITRALWAVRNGNGYEVFAGGTRMEAARRANLAEIPVILHEGLTEEDIVRLADEDNENDAYHKDVPCADTWLSYKALADIGWTQERIGKAKDKKQQRVSRYLKYAEFPASVLGYFTKNDFLKDSHAEEISKLQNFCNLSPWVVYEQVLLDVVDAVLKKSPTSPTAAQFKERVTEYNTLITFVQDCLNQIEDDWRPKFLKELRQTRSTDQVQKVFTRITEQIAAERARQEREALLVYQKAEKARLEAELKAEREAGIRMIMNLLVCGDAREAIVDAPGDIAMLLTDPPYGKDFQSNRRVNTEKAEKIEGDSDIQEALDLLKDVLEKSYPKMTDDSTLFVFSSQDYEPEFRQAIKQSGFTYRKTYIWRESNHGSGDLERTHAPQHECIIHAVKGDPKLKGNRPSSVMDGSEFLKSEHPTKKPLDLLRLLIEAWTDEGDRIADPFAGVGSTVIAAKQARRKFWACELHPEYHKFMADTLLKMIQKEEA